MQMNNSPQAITAVALRWLLLALMTGTLLSLTACGSTKVYTADKTVIYGDSVYNVSNVSVFSTRVDGVISDSETIELKNVDKKAFNDLLDQHDSIFVRQVITFDDKDMVYQATNVDSWSDYNRMAKRFSSANKDLTKFLGDKKKTQLKLK